MTEYDIPNSPNQKYRKTIMTLAPIIVFAYNRPDYLRKTLTRIEQNES